MILNDKDCDVDELMVSLAMEIDDDLNDDDSPLPLGKHRRRANPQPIQLYGERELMRCDEVWKITSVHNIVDQEL